MLIAIVTRANSPHSIRIYRDNIVKRMEAIGAGVKFMEINTRQSLPAGIDMIWEPTLAGALGPSANLKHADKPIVATVHGAAPFAVPLGWIWSGLVNEAKRAVFKFSARRNWKWFAKKVHSVIVVSEFGRAEVCKAFDLDSSKVTVIPHGLDHDIFTPDGKDDISAGKKQKFFLHVSAYKGLKNLPRIFKAYKKYRNSCGSAAPAELLVISPGCKLGTGGIDGIKIVTRNHSPQELAELYRSAAALVLPSLRESFGMPILEAFGCGCPVITSDRSGCREVAGEAAILVDPFSIEAIAQAMVDIDSDAELAGTLSEKSIARAKEFSWDKTAQAHYELFTRVVTGGSDAG